MELRAFKQRWPGWYPDVPPIGHLMRERHPESWLRIHSLPDSKRYPDTKDEWAELLVRQNAVATAALGASSSCLLVSARFAEPREQMPELLADSRLASSKALLTYAPRLVDGGWPGEQAAGPRSAGIRVGFYAAAVDWRSGAHDELLRAVASDEERFVIADCSSGRVYAPYDGGADLFFPDAPGRRAARETFRSWLSPLASGL